jgi:thiol-disulfide isomerase/thioredoxin
VCALLFITFDKYVPRVDTDVIAGSYSDRDILQSRIRSFSVTWDYNGRRFPEIVISTTVGAEKRERVSTDGRNIIAVLSNSGCNMCQIRELAHLDSLYKAAIGVSIQGLYFDPFADDRDQLHYGMSSMLNAARPSFVVNSTESSVLADFVNQSGTPIIFEIHDGVIVTTFKPIPDDDIFSSAFHSTLMSRYGGSQMDSVLSFKTMLRPPYRNLSASHAIQDLEGVNHTLGSVYGSPTIVNFWATWCGPCIQEMPSLSDLNTVLERETSGKVILLSSEPLATVRRYMSRRDFSMDSYVVSDTILDSYSKGVLPTTLVVTSNGDVLHEVYGARDWKSSNLVEYIKALEKLQ